MDQWSRARFERYRIPLVQPECLHLGVVSFDQGDTAVTPLQMQVLIASLEATESVEGPIVEIGAYRGVTLAVLAPRTKRDYVAVDPYIGYGGAEADLEIMMGRIKNLRNVRHLRVTSGEAHRQQLIDRTSFVFVDAVHDYINAAFDGNTWGCTLNAGGVIAFHDTDSRAFAGVQRAVWQMLNHADSQYDTFAHVEGLIVLRRVSHADSRPSPHL